MAKTHRTSCRVKMERPMPRRASIPSSEVGGAFVSRPQLQSGQLRGLGEWEVQKETVRENRRRTRAEVRRTERLGDEGFGEGGEVGSRKSSVGWCVCGGEDDRDGGGVAISFLPWRKQAGCVNF